MAALATTYRELNTSTYNSTQGLFPISNSTECEKQFNLTKEDDTYKFGGIEQNINHPYGCLLVPELRVGVFNRDARSIVDCGANVSFLVENQIEYYNANCITRSTVPACQVDPSQTAAFKFPTECICSSATQNNTCRANQGCLGGKCVKECENKDGIGWNKDICFCQENRYTCPAYSICGNFTDSDGGYLCDSCINPNTNVFDNVKCPNVTIPPTMAPTSAPSPASRCTLVTGKKNDPSCDSCYTSCGKTFTFNNRTELDDALCLWHSNQDMAIGQYGDINRWNVSQVTDMSFLFQDQAEFDSDIRCWDTFQVTNMNSMFLNARKFHQNIDIWRTYRVKDMTSMFENATTFNQNLNIWDVSQVTAMSFIFKGAKAFNRNLVSWTPNWQATFTLTSNGENFNQMFDGSPSDNPNLHFKLPAKYDNSTGPNMTKIDCNETDCNCKSITFDDRDQLINAVNAWVRDESFVKAEYGNINNWGFSSSIEDMSFIFQDLWVFNSDISCWSVSSVTTMKGMFSRATTFNGDISNWNVSSVTNMNSMFKWAASLYMDNNQSLSRWDVSSVKDMSHMFESEGTTIRGRCSGVPGCSQCFQYALDKYGPKVAYSRKLVIGYWSGVPPKCSVQSGGDWAAHYNFDPVGYPSTSYTTIATFLGVNNFGISEWDVSEVTNMSYMFFLRLAFNQTLTRWNTHKVTNMMEMFRRCYYFNQDLSRWNTERVTNMRGMFHETRRFNQSLRTVRITREDNTTYTAWNMSQVTTLRYMFRHSYAFNGDISNWDVSRVTDMYGLFEGAVFNGNISEWNTQSVKYMGAVFYGARSFNQDISRWNTDNVIQMRRMFSSANSFNQNLLTRNITRNGYASTAWNTSRVTDMFAMFFRAYAFNGDISNWDTSTVTSMRMMFREARVFNGQLATWDVGNVRNTEFMFTGARVFNQDISRWDVSKVTNMRGMFSSTQDFNQNISKWNVSKVTLMALMFKGTQNFVGDLSAWRPESVRTMTELFWNSEYEKGVRSLELSAWGVVMPKPLSNIKMIKMFSNCDSRPYWYQEPDCCDGKTSKGYRFADKPELEEAIAEWVNNETTAREIYTRTENGKTYNDINTWDISKITDLSNLFSNFADFDGDIECWDTAQVTSISYMVPAITYFWGRFLAAWSRRYWNNNPEQTINTTGLLDEDPICVVGGNASDCSSSYAGTCQLYVTNVLNSSLVRCTCKYGYYGTNCELCASGYRRVGEYCTECLVGTFNTNPSNNEECTDMNCSLGKGVPFDEGLAQNTCVSCAVGNYSNSTDSSVCKSCPEGRYSNVVGSSICLLVNPTKLPTKPPTKSPTKFPTRSPTKSPIGISTKSLLTTSIHHL